MQYALALLAIAGAANAIPQGAPSGVGPKAAAPAGCSPDYSGQFQITAVSVTQKRDLAARDSSCGSEGTLTISLAGGVLTDAKGRIGSIVANRQFQFDGPPAQTGAIYTGGFSACSNGSLALGGSAVFYQCLSGSFYNLYDESWAPQCSPVEIAILPCSGTSTGPVITGAADGQPQGTAIAQITDGQPQAAAAIPISEKADGQPQMPTALPPAITQIGDGQLQAPTGKPVSQIGDGQVQAPTSGKAPVSQIGDGQVQAPTGVPVSQIGDGQVQAPTGVPVTQIGDGQIQAPTGAPISQIGDGQIQVGNATTPVAPATYTGAASLFNVGVEVAALAAGVAVVAML